MAAHGRNDERYSMALFHIGDDLIYQDRKMGDSPAPHSHGNTPAPQVERKRQTLQFLSHGSAHILQVRGRKTLPDAGHGRKRDFGKMKQWRLDGYGHMSPGGGLFVYQLYSIQTHDKNKGKHKIIFYITYCNKIFYCVYKMYALRWQTYTFSQRLKLRHKKARNDFHHCAPSWCGYGRH